jgi:hypothetical protein
MKRSAVAPMSVALVLAAAAAPATAPSSAVAALPEYRTCIRAVPRSTGQFDDRFCSVASAGGGRFELGAWNEGRKLTFKGKGGVATLRGFVPENELTPWTGGASVAPVQCKTAKATGELTGPKTSTLTLELRSCSSEDKKCTSPGAKTAVVVTRPLTATLGYVLGGVGVDVEASDHGAFAEFACEGLGVVTRGSVIGTITGNVDSVSREATLTFATNATNGQLIVLGEFPEDLETGLVHYLRSTVTPPGVALPSSDSATAVLKGEALEVDA